MAVFDQTVSDNSIWITSTPTPVTQKFPFYVTEAGRFYADINYAVNRDFHDSYILLYTQNGNGIVKTGDITIALPQGHAVIIDCRTPHEYFSRSDLWDFSWIHFRGDGIENLFDILYPDNSIRSVTVKHRQMFEQSIASLIEKASKADIKSNLYVSQYMHELVNSIYSSMLVHDTDKIDSASDIKSVIAFIEDNYNKPISVDDMIEPIHISKYHFIRRFRCIMGITPYHYLTNHRITVAKTLLRTTDKSIAEISELCGFADTSNFITHFKKQTGQKPLSYRQDFT